MEKFEDLLKELEQIVNDLEKNDLPLDEAIKKYERGMELSKRCNDMLEASKEAIVKKMSE